MSNVSPGQKNKHFAQVKVQHSLAFYWIKNKFILNQNLPVQSVVCYWTIHKEQKLQDNNNIPDSYVELCNQWMLRLLCGILHTDLNSFAQLYVPGCIAGVPYKSNKIFKKKQQSFEFLPFLGTCTVGTKLNPQLCLFDSTNWIRQKYSSTAHFLPDFTRVHFSSGFLTISTRSFQNVCTFKLAM